jgi:glyoxylate carboligase
MGRAVTALSQWLSLARWPKAMAVMAGGQSVSDFRLTAILQTAVHAMRDGRLRLGPIFYDDDLKVNIAERRYHPGE